MSQGDIFKKLVKRAGLTQDQFAEKIGSSRSTVINLMQRSVLPDEWIDRICEALNVEKSVFLSKEILENDVTSMDSDADDYVYVSKKEYAALMALIDTQRELIHELKKK